MALTARQAVEAKSLLIEMLYRKNPRRGRAAAVAEANRLLGERGRQAVEEAERKLARKAKRKAVRKAVDEALLRREIRETLTAAQAAAPPPGTGLAMVTDDADHGLMGAVAGTMRSPFWNFPVVPPADAAAPEPPKPLHQMDTDEFRSHADGALVAYSRAHGFGSPVWQ